MIHIFCTGSEYEGKHHLPPVVPMLAQPFVNLGPLSSPAIPDSLIYASRFLLGVGMVIIQPSSGKVVLVNDPTEDHWFLPKGRKDMGETLEHAALREAYEEVSL